MKNQSIQNFKNLYTFQNDIELKDAGGGTVFGKSIVEYEIYKRRDLSNLNTILGYFVVMKQRIIIPTNSSYQAGPTSATSYKNYPAILFNEIDIKVNNNAKVVLKSIFPKTLNSSVSTSTSSSDGTSSSNSHQNSNGSNNTNVNTFGVAITGGFFGELPMGSITLDYSHSWENSKFRSSMKGGSTAVNSNIGASESMSIKDWSSYGYLDNDSISPRWIWGQSYPWDVIQYNQSSDASHIKLPTFVLDRLKNGNLVLPPSQLSLFGTDFTMQAAWLIDFPKGVTSDETITLSHITRSYTASHELSGGQISATLQTQSAANEAKYTSGALSLSSYALNPILGSDAGSGAAIGFTANEFAYPPTSPTVKFKIVSPANNVQVTGSGFDSIMKSSFKQNPSLTIAFKIVDIKIDYSLLLMHWIGESSGSCKLNWTVNEKWKGTIYVESVEGAGGQNNISSIDLRNTDFTSVNFHDYLNIGANKITIDVEPVNTSIPTEYNLFALTIGKV